MLSWVREDQIDVYCESIVEKANDNMNEVKESGGESVEMDSDKYPYVHGCARIHFLKRDLIDFIDNFFSVQNFITTRERFDLLPINGQNMCFEASSANVLPPPFRM